MDAISSMFWRLPEITLSRFPFISALTLLMTLAERDESYFTGQLSDRQYNPLI
jgi:hypothetical protein